jgi:hypothetical protein
MKVIAVVTGSYLTGAEEKKISEVSKVNPDPDDRNKQGQPSP